MAPKLRAGVIGCGGIARMHLDGYLNCGRYEVVGLADLRPEAMLELDEQFGEREDYHPKHYLDARSMLAAAEFDVISVCVGTRGHATWTIAAAAARPKAILCEKPMADHIGHAAEMQVVCQRNGVKLAIGHQRRFLPAYTLARKLIAEGAIGEVRLITSLGADGLPNYSSHQTDMYRYVLGDDGCEWVMGNVERLTDRMERGTRIEDRAMGVFQFRGGARALLLSDLVPHVYQGAVVYGAEGTIDLTTTELRLLNAQTGGRWEVHRPEGKFFTAGADRFEHLEASAGQAAELADWVEGQVDSHRGEGVNGYKALEMVHAVYESARLHERVVLPLQTRTNPLDEMVDSGALPVRYPGRFDIRASHLRGEHVLYEEDEA